MSKSAPDNRLGLADGALVIRHIFVRNLELLGHIGIHGHEQGKLQPIRINVDLTVEDHARLEDRLEKVVDYEAVKLPLQRMLPSESS